MPDNAGILSGLVRNMKARGTDPLRPLVDAYLLERDRAPERHLVEHDMTPRPRPPGRLSPSALGGCPRAAAFAFAGVKGRRRVDPDAQLIFDDGDWRHLKWEHTFRDMECVLGRERFRVIAIEQAVMYPELYISGSLDCILWLRPWPQKPGRKYVVDIKGINNTGFEFLLRNQAPIAKHVQQLQAYERAAGVPRGLLWYENKNNQLTKAFLVNYNDDGWREVEAWATSVVAHLRRKRIPPKAEDCVQGNIQWERCPYSKLCYGGKTLKDLERLTYKGFDLDEAWESGNAQG